MNTCPTCGLDADDNTCPDPCHRVRPRAEEAGTALSSETPALDRMTLYRQLADIYFLDNESDEDWDEGMKCEGWVRVADFVLSALHQAASVARAAAIEECARLIEPEVRYRSNHVQACFCVTCQSEIALDGLASRIRSLPPHARQPEKPDV